MKVKQLYVRRMLWLKSSGAMENSCVYSPEYCKETPCCLCTCRCTYFTFSGKLELMFKMREHL